MEKLANEQQYLRHSRVHEAEEACEMCQNPKVSVTSIAPAAAIGLAS